MRTKPKELPLIGIGTGDVAEIIDGVDLSAGARGIGNIVCGEGAVSRANEPVIRTNCFGIVADDDAVIVHGSHYDVGGVEGSEGRS